MVCFTSMMMALLLVWDSGAGPPRDRFTFKSEMLSKSMADSSLVPGASIHSAVNSTPLAALQGDPIASLLFVKSRGLPVLPMTLLCWGHRDISPVGDVWRTSGCASGWRRQIKRCLAYRLSYGQEMKHERADAAASCRWMLRRCSVDAP